VRLLALDPDLDTDLEEDREEDREALCCCPIKLCAAMDAKHGATDLLLCSVINVKGCGSVS
jgi:hypothetical protein